MAQEIEASSRVSSSSASTVDAPGFETAGFSMSLKPMKAGGEASAVDPFLCVQLDHSELEPSSIYEFELHRFRIGPIYKNIMGFGHYPLVWAPLGADGMLPKRARLKLGDRLRSAQLSQLRAEILKGRELEIRGVLRQIEARPARSATLHQGARVRGIEGQGAEGQGAEGQIGIASLSSYNRSLSLELATPSRSRYERASHGKGKSGWVRSPSKISDDLVWVGPGRAWAMQMPKNLGFREATDSYLGAWSGIEIGLTKIDMLSPFGAVWQDLAESTLGIFERRVVTEQEVELKLRVESAEELLCGDLPREG